MNLTQQGLRYTAELVIRQVEKVALIAGANGIIGKALMEELSATRGWKVRGLGRRRVDGRESIICDLLDAGGTRAALHPASDTTHVFYSALAPGRDLAEEVELNGSMLRNLLDGLDSAKARLERVVLYQGAKIYGIHLGPVQAPFYEDDNPPHLGPNFYRVHEAELERRAAAGICDYSILRPDVVIGDTAVNAMNIATVIGAYAAICRANGAAFRFPGTEQVYRHVFAQMTDARALARASLWAAQSPAAAGQAFNYVHEPFRWERIWRAVAEAFDLPLGPPSPMTLTMQMSYHSDTWDRMRAEQGLGPMEFSRAVRWDFGDFVFGSAFDLVSDMGKIRRAGFTETVDTRRALIDAIKRQQASGVLPR